MTDLEEEVLFRLTGSASQAFLTLAENISGNMDKRVPLGILHETLLRLENEGLIESTRLGTRKRYTLTESGKATLQRDWDHYRSLYKA